MPLAEAARALGKSKAKSGEHFVMGHWREGRLGAVRMGLEHGAYCVGCCWGLMVVLFALGVT